MNLTTSEVEVNNDTDYKILRVYLDENWSASDFSNLFESLSVLNDIFIEIETINLTGYKIQNNILNNSIADKYINLNGEIYKKLNFSDVNENSRIISDKQLFELNFYKPLILENNALKIKEIKYASPGWSDFIGLGKIIENVFDLVKFYLPNKSQKIQNEIAEIDLLERKIEMIRKYDFSDIDKERYLNLKNSGIRNLKHLETLGKIKSLEIKELN